MIFRSGEEPEASSNEQISGPTRPDLRSTTRLNQNKFGSRYLMCRALVKNDRTQVRLGSALVLVRLVSRYASFAPRRSVSDFVPLALTAFAQMSLVGPFQMASTNQRREMNHKRGYWPRLTSKSFSRLFLVWPRTRNNAHETRQGRGKAANKA